jgi:hypothetical protein
MNLPTDSPKHLAFSQPPARVKITMVEEKFPQILDLTLHFKHNCLPSATIQATFPIQKHG